MAKIFVLFTIILCLTAGFLPLQSVRAADVGGHVVLSIYDRPSGKSNGVQSSNSVGFTLRRFFLYFSQEISDKISVELEPEWSASTGATPRLGSPIAKKTNPGDVEAEFHGLVKAQVTMLLPKDFELSFGIVKPLFSWDYGRELFWGEEFNGGKWSCNTALGAVHDAGFELYKTFEFGDVSLPAYFYLLNGASEYGDNNKMPAIMATVEPDFGALKLKSSVYTGTWNDAYDEEGVWGKYGADDKALKFFKYLFGVSFEKGPFSIRSEYAASNWSGKLADNQDAKQMGFYVKAFYRFSSWARFMLHYDYVDYNYSGSALGDEKYVTISPTLQIYPDESTGLFIVYDIADWKRDRSGVKDTAKFNRLTTGLRVTF